MNTVEQNPFRVLGIPVNARATDLAANKGKMRLLDVGKEVTFPLDLPGLLAKINRTKDAVATAERDINLPQDKIKHALFWFAAPKDTIGKFGYERLLQGDIDDAMEKLGKSNTWESLLSLSTLYLQKSNVSKAISLMSIILDLHCEEFVSTVAGQTHTEDASDVMRHYLTALSREVDAGKLYSQLITSDVSAAMLDELKSIAVDAPIAAIEKEISTAKSVDKDDSQAQLRAGKSLMSNTQKDIRQLKQLVGSADPRYSRLADKLANQILQCSINYHNAIDESSSNVTASVIDECLKLAEYAKSIAVGRITRERIEKNVEILHDKKSQMPPAGVESDVEAVMNALKFFVSKPDKIEYSVTLLNSTKIYLQSIKAKLGGTDKFYLKLSTQVVSNALHNLIEEVNQAQKEPESLYDSQADKALRLLRISNAVTAAWNCTKIMDTFDMESDFRTNRYIPNRNSLQNMYNQLRQISSQLSASRSSSTFSSSSYGSTSTGSSSGDDTNWGCIVWGIIGFIIFIIIMANQ